MRRRILSAILGITAAALITLGVPLGWFVGRAYRSEQLTRLHAAATVAAGTVPAEGLHGPDPIEPPSVPAGIQLGYYDTTGTIAAGRGTARVDAQAGEALRGHPSEGASGSRLTAAVPIIANEGTVGAVEASSSGAALSARTRRAWLAMAALGLLALAVATLIGVWQARRLTGPVDRLVLAAGRVGEGDFEVTVARSGIAEIDRAGAALEAASSRLGDLMRRERAFTSHASHQLRTPLTALRLDLEGALETPGVDTATSLADAIAQVDRLHETLEQLFALARTGDPAGRMISLAEVLGPLEQRWRPILAEQGRRLTVSAEDSITARDVHACLAQILDILVDNAARHGRGMVAVSAGTAAGWLRVEVDDEGGGISALPDPGLPRTAPDHNWHGIGLPLARSLAEGAGGTLVLRQPGPHTVIAVLVP